MRDVLLIAYFFPPMGDGGVFRSLKLARYLPEQGWRPIVLCGRPEDYWVSDESLLTQLPRDLSVTRVAGWTGQSLLRRLKGGAKDSPSGGAESRLTGELRKRPAASRSSSRFRRLRALGDFCLLPDSYRGWIHAALRAGRALLAEHDIQLIYSSSPPDSDHLVARRLSRESGLPWVADFRDPWFNLHLKNPPSALHGAWHRRQEAAVLREAQVVAVTEGWQAYYAERATRPPRLIRNGFDPADFAGLPPPRRTGEDGRLRLLHTGKLSLTRSVAPLLEGVAALLARHPEWRETLTLDFLGPRESDNEATATALGLDDIVNWLPSLDHAGSVARQREADLLLLIKHDDERYRDLIPGKFYEYVAADRPILAITPAGEIEGLMATHELGWTLRPRAEEIAAALPAILSELAAGRDPRESAPAEFTRPEQTRLMASLFDELAEGGWR